MPLSCHSYPHDAPSGGGNRGAVQSAMPGVRRMPAGTCFGY